MNGIKILGFNIRNYGLPGGYMWLRRRINAIFSVQSRRAAKSVRRSMAEDVLYAQKKYEFSRKPLISILMPVYNTDLDMLDCAVKSVLDQTYENWELCICDASDEECAPVEFKCTGYAQRDSRIKYRMLTDNKGIAANTNECAAMASGEYIALLDHDDILHPSALYKVAREIERTDADFIYTDEMTFEGSIDKVWLTNLKPDYSPDTLRGNNYICHFTVFTRKLYGQVGAFRLKYDGSQDHDMFLRMTAAAKKVSHIPEILYFWRAHESSVVGGIDAKKYAVEAGIKAVKDNLADWGFAADVLQSGVYPTIYRIKYDFKERPLVSVIITCKFKPAADGNPDHDEQKKYIKTLRISNYPRYDVLHTASDSASINECVKNSAAGSYILLLDGSGEPEKPDWMRELLQYVVRKDIGAVGTALLNRDGTVDSRYMITGMSGGRGVVPAGRGLYEDDNGYLGRFGFVQNVNALNSSCLMVNRDKFIEVGGLDEKLSVNYNRIDLCLKLAHAGYNNVYTPFAAFRRTMAKTVKESARTVSRKAEADYFAGKWGEALCDPYYNPNFRKDGTFLL